MNDLDRALKDIIKKAVELQDLAKINKEVYVISNTALMKKVIKTRAYLKYLYARLNGIEINYAGFNNNLEPIFWCGKYQFIMVSEECYRLKVVNEVKTRTCRYSVLEYILKNEQDKSPPNNIR